jgi:hypothetical protein
MMPCYDMSLWQVMSMMDGTERLKENYTHTATLLPICRQQLHDGGQTAGHGFYISSFVASCGGVTTAGPNSLCGPRA